MARSLRWWPSWRVSSRPPPRLAVVRMKRAARPACPSLGTASPPRIPPWLRTWSQSSTCSTQSLPRWTASRGGSSPWRCRRLRRRLQRGLRVRALLRRPAVRCVPIRRAVGCGRRSLPSSCPRCRALWAVAVASTGWTPSRWTALGSAWSSRSSRSCRLAWAWPRSPRGPLRQTPPAVLPPACMGLPSRGRACCMPTLRVR